jgi:hypothetical protein
MLRRHPLLLGAAEVVADAVRYTSRSRWLSSCCLARRPSSRSEAAEMISPEIDG